MNPAAQCGCGAEGTVNTCISTVDTCAQAAPQPAPSNPVYVPWPPPPGPTPVATKSPVPAPTPAPAPQPTLGEITAQTAFSTASGSTGSSVAVPNLSTLAVVPAVGNIIQLTDSNGNTFTSIVTQVNPDNTVEFADQVVCGKEVTDCDFAKGASIAFSQGSATAVTIQVKAVTKANPPEPAGCTPVTPCASGVGDCDTNADCAGALVCVPSSDGKLSGGGYSDYCGAAADQNIAGKGQKGGNDGKGQKGGNDGKGQKGGKGLAIASAVGSAGQTRRTREKWAAGPIGVVCIAVGVVIAARKLGGASEHPTELEPIEQAAPKLADPTSPRHSDYVRL